MVGDLIGSALPSIVSVLTAVLAFVLGKYLWNWYRQPVLVFRGSSTRNAPGESVVQDSDSVPMVHQIEVVNEGAIAAQNCKPELALRGSDDTHSYEVEVPVCWSERDNPARVTVNAGERTSFDFFVKFRKDVDDFIRFPSASGWPDRSTLQVDAKDDYISSVDGAVVSHQGKNREPVETFPDIDWEKSVVRVTAENAVLAEAEVTMEWEIGSQRREDVELIVEQTTGPLRRYFPRF